MTMTRHEIVTGNVLDNDALTVEELACACRVSADWVVEHVEAGLLVADESQGEWRFASTHLSRARRLVTIERRFDANQEVAALVADLIEEVERLRARLGNAPR
jgi:chaperone modulatory protein CbpM